MGTSSGKKKLKTNTKKPVPAPVPAPASVPAPAPASVPANLPASSESARKRRIRTKKKKYSFPERYEFVEKVPYLIPTEAHYLDQLRDDLQESIERVVRVQAAFVKALDLNAFRSERVKTIANSIGLVKFYAEEQRKIVSRGITEVLDSKAVEAKRKREEAAEEAWKKKLQKIEEGKSACPGCYITNL